MLKNNKHVDFDEILILLAIDKEDILIIESMQSKIR